MPKKICVYTCITGNYDNLHEIENPESGIDYYCFTNNKNLKSSTWKIIQIQDDSLDNCRLARKIKILGHPSITKYDICVWTDADIIWQKNIHDFVRNFLANKPFAIFKHHARNTVHDEAIACLLLGRDSKANITKILNFYKDIKYPDNNGLYESTVFVKHQKDPLVQKTMAEWFSFIENYSKRDQLSFPYVIWKNKLQLNTIKLNVWNNSWFTYEKHLPSGKINTCNIYYGDPQNNFDFNKFFEYTYNNPSPYTYSLSAKIPFDTPEIHISLTTIPGMSYKNLTIKPKPKNYRIVGSINYGNFNILYTTNSELVLFGNFKKNQSISFSIVLQPAGYMTVMDLAENLWHESHKLNEQLEKTIRNYDAIINSHQQHEAELQDQLNQILSSKGWKILEAAHKIIPHHKS